MAMRSTSLHASDEHVSSAERFHEPLSCLQHEPAKSCTESKTSDSNPQEDIVKDGSPLVGARSARHHHERYQMLLPGMAQLCFRRGCIQMCNSDRVLSTVS